MEGGGTPFGEEAAYRKREVPHKGRERSVPVLALIVRLGVLDIKVEVARLALPDHLVVVPTTASVRK